MNNLKDKMIRDWLLNGYTIFLLIHYVEYIFLRLTEFLLPKQMIWSAKNINSDWNVFVMTPLWTPLKEGKNYSNKCLNGHQRLNFMRGLFFSFSYQLIKNAKIFIKTFFCLWLKSLKLTDNLTLTAFMVDSLVNIFILIDV